MLSDGKLNAPVKITERVSLGEFFTRSQDNRSPSTEKNTVYTEDIHIVHLRRFMGENTTMADVNAAMLQDYHSAHGHVGVNGESVKYWPRSVVRISFSIWPWRPCSLAGLPDSTSVAALRARS